MNIEIRKEDQVFTDSPDAGDADCLCSRCGLPIGEDEVPVRAWKGDDDGVGLLEYRFHPACLGMHVAPGGGRRR